MVIASSRQYSAFVVPFEEAEEYLMYPQGGYAAAVASFRWQRLRSIFCFWC